MASHGGATAVVYTKILVISSGSGTVLPQNVQANNIFRMKNMQTRTPRMKAMIP